jgi:hypothetical protein
MAECVCVCVWGGGGQDACTLAGFPLRPEINLLCVGIPYLALDPLGYMHHAHSLSSFPYNYSGIAIHLFICVFMTDLSMCRHTPLSNRQQVKPVNM